MFTTTTKIRIRKEFKDAHPDKKVLCGNATDFKGDYVEWLERQLNDLRIANVSQQRELLIGYSKLILGDNYEAFEEFELKKIDEYLANL